MFFFHITCMNNDKIAFRCVKDEFNGARDKDKLRPSGAIMIINVCTTNIVKIVAPIASATKPNIARYLKYG